MMSKMVKCKNCKEEIDAKAVVCPKCGVKVKKAFYKKPWFIIAVAIVIVAAIASCGGDEESKKVSEEVANVEASATEEIVYEEYSVSELINDLDSNALKAEKTYDGKNLKLTGKVSNIDSDGEYISLEPSDNSFSFTSVQCYISDEAQLEMVMELSVGQNITVYGEVTSVGEILGYSLKLHKIEY